MGRRRYDEAATHASAPSALRGALHGRRHGWGRSHRDVGRLTVPFRPGGRYLGRGRQRTPGGHRRPRGDRRRLDRHGARRIPGCAVGVGALRPGAPSGRGRGGAEAGRGSCRGGGAPRVVRREPRPESRRGRGAEAPAQRVGRFHDEVRAGPRKPDPRRALVSAFTIARHMRSAACFRCCPTCSSAASARRWSSRSHSRWRRFSSSG
jgi:hypothetical protein